MYRVSSIDGDRWRIVDACGRLVFVGTQLQGEEWLDRQENLRPRQSALGAFLSGVVDDRLRSLATLMGRNNARARVANP
jgi:hypothetical protein